MPSILPIQIGADHTLDTYLADRDLGKGSSLSTATNFAAFWRSDRPLRFMCLVSQRRSLLIVLRQKAVPRDVSTCSQPTFKEVMGKTGDYCRTHVMMDV